MQCKYTKSDGSRCRGFTVSGSDYCWRHSSVVKDFEKKSASSRGGRNRSLIPVNLPQIIINDTRDIPPLLVDTIQHLRSGEIDVRLGTAVGYLSNILLKSYEVADIENRMEKIEKFIDEKLCKAV
jgi:hypothetical protein